MTVVPRTLRPLTATYRLQFNESFTLHHAYELIPYLHELGVSHIYCSPLLAARKGSMHGYDVVDPSRVSEALGGEPALRTLADAAHDRGMGVILDIVPNHMATGAENPYWWDLLMYGEQSRYASWFDVGWRSASRRLAGKVLLPVLGDTLSRVVSRDELSIAETARGAELRYFSQAFPLMPDTVPTGVNFSEWTRGEEGRKRLRALLRKQRYELAFWRTGNRDLNYRRFFDVNDLVSIRVEEPEVFAATHALVLRLIGDGMIDGVRVDHVDGLLEPAVYLDRLRSAIDAVSPGGAHIPVFVEKILATGETLPPEWPVEGTTGYEFMVAVDNLLLDGAGLAQIEKRYRRGTNANGFAAVALASKRRVLRSTMNADVRRVAPLLAKLAKRVSWPECTIGQYAGAIVEVIAQLPVYRSYIDSMRPVANERDAPVLRAAIGRASDNARVDRVAVSALRRALLDEWRAESPGSSERMKFVLQLQQLGAPAAAKGVEDTALYAYAPLTSRSEVGGDPEVSVDFARAHLEERFEDAIMRHPLTLNAVSTHDTKRSADARARIDALSEYAAQWTRLLSRWRKSHSRYRTGSRGGVPSAVTEDFIYQSMLAIWQAGETEAVLNGRIKAYMMKAIREAKTFTSWADPDSAYETSVSSFIDCIMSDEAFKVEMDELSQTISSAAQRNILTRSVLQLTAPGTPDVYQGDEIMFTALVDPDNRRPVDWDRRRATLGRMLPMSAHDHDVALRAMCGVNKPDDLKMFVVHELLSLRNHYPDLFQHGDVRPLVVRGTYAERVVAYRRNWQHESVLVITARAAASLGSWPVGDVWGDTALEIGTEGPITWQCALHREPRDLTGPTVFLRELLTILPSAVLIS